MNKNLSLKNFFSVLTRHHMASQKFILPILQKLGLAPPVQSQYGTGRPPSTHVDDIHATSWIHLKKAKRYVFNKFQRQLELVL